MYQNKYPHLFEPLSIGGAFFKNRIFSGPQGFYYLGKDNLPSEEEIAFFERKSIGGFASICIGDCDVHPSTGTHYPYVAHMDDPSTLPGLSMLARSISRHGAVASVELSHAGMYARFLKDPIGTMYGPRTESKKTDSNVAIRPLYGPVAMADGKYGEVEEMPEEIILEIIEAFGDSAAWAKRCGYGMVTIHGGHGWLFSQFMSPYLNTRKDKWGGSLENRMRFTLATIENIRKKTGQKFPIEFRMSGSEGSTGYALDEGIHLAKAMDDYVDIIHVSAGDHEGIDGFFDMEPSMFQADGHNVHLAQEIKKHVKSPVATVGALSDPALMEDIIASGKADIVVLGRQTLADPDLPLKAKSGRDDDIHRCLRCSSCLTMTGTNRFPECAINPTISHELAQKKTSAPLYKKKVLVIGGGVGGMQAALTAEKRGHDVTLCEKAEALGGVLRSEKNIPFKAKMVEYIERQARIVQRSSVKILLNTEVTPEMARSYEADAIIAALGACYAIPPIKGIDSKNVMGAEELYLNPEKAGKNISIIGGGLVGLELAIFMAEKGHKVIIVEAMDQLNIDPTSLHALAIADQIQKHSIDIRLSTKINQITEMGISCVGPDGELKIAADTVVYATGMIPLREEAAAFRDCAPEFYQIGDCVSPKDIMAANHTGYTVAMDIGRI